MLINTPDVNVCQNIMKGCHCHQSSHTKQKDSTEPDVAKHFEDRKYLIFCLLLSVSLLTGVPLCSGGGVR